MARKGKLNKKKSKIGDIERPPRSKKYKYLILIVCEDQGTEPYYFKQYKERFESLLPDETVYLRTYGTGRDSLGVVNKAIEFRELLSEEAEGKVVDQTWAVFDKDDHDLNPKKIERFEKAFKLAEDSNIRVAYSNECFELWLLLHFDNVERTSSIPRQKIYKKLESYVVNNIKSDFTYEHGHKDIIDIIKEHGDQTQAIIRAQELHKYHDEINHTPLESNPNTLMYRLILELESQYEYYSY